MGLSRWGQGKSEHRPGREGGLKDSGKKKSCGVDIGVAAWPWKAEEVGPDGKAEC